MGPSNREPKITRVGVHRHNNTKTGHAAVHPPPLCVNFLLYLPRNQATPGSGDSSAAFPGFPFHSSASAGASPLRVIFGH